MWDGAKLAVLYSEPAGNVLFRLACRTAVASPGDPDSWHSVAHGSTSSDAIPQNTKDLQWFEASATSCGDPFLDSLTVR